MAWQRPAACNNISDVEVSLEELMIGLVIICMDFTKLTCPSVCNHFTKAKFPIPMTKITKLQQRERLSMGYWY